MKVGIGTSPGTPDVYHRLEGGAVACRLGRRPDREFRTVERDSLDDSVEECSFCAGTATVHHDGGVGFATKLRAADGDLAEVLGE